MRWTLWMWVALSACNQAAPPETPPPPPPVAATPPPAAQTSAAQWKILAPSPLTLEEQVKKAGIAGDLGAFVHERTFAFEGKKPDSIATYTGVLLADTIFVGGTASKADFLERLKTLRSGMAAIGAGEGLVGTIDDFIVAVQNDTADRADFLTELDGIAGMMIPADGWGPKDKTGPLVQAGAWLEGTNLVAKAIVASKEPKALDLLRQGDAVDFFRGYLKGDGAEKLPDGLREKVIAGLDQLSAIAAKPTLTLEDARATANITDEILALL